MRPSAFRPNASLAKARSKKVLVNVKFLYIISNLETKKAQGRDKRITVLHTANTVVLFHDNKKIYKKLRNSLALG